MIWLTNFPLPPSVNEYLQPVAGKWTHNKKGKAYQKGRFVKTEIHRNYERQCLSWSVLHNNSFMQIKAALHRAFEQSRQRSHKFALRVDCFFVFEYSRLWTQSGHAQQLDADNRLKPCRDVLAKLIGIDDKHFFSGYFEKLSTHSKDLECTYLKISQMTPRTLEDLKIQVKTENPGF